MTDKITVAEAARIVDWQRINKFRLGQVQGFGYGDDGIQMMVRDCWLPPSEQIVWEKNSTPDTRDDDHDEMMRQIEIYQMTLALRALTDQPEAPAQDQWQPIETAPKDGTEFQAWIAQNSDGGYWEPHCRINEWGDFEVWGRVDYDIDDWEISPLPNTPTHWMPRPAPPAPDGAQVETVTLYGVVESFLNFFERPCANGDQTHRLTLPADMKPRVYTAPDKAQVIVERIDDE